MTAEYLRPIPITDAAVPSGALRLAGGWVRFTHVEILARGAAPRIVPATEIAAERLAPFLTPRAPFGGLTLDRPRLMGIVNVTPDSFSDGGEHAATDAAVAHARTLLAQGADLIDIGGESTRPGAPETPASEEIARVLPVVRALRADGLAVPISLDTRKSAVAAPGLAAGAGIVNDVSGLRHDPGLARVAADSGAGLIVMHSIGTPQTMQALAPEAYGDVLLDVYDALACAVARAEAAGLSRSRLMVDPGIGFGKTLEQNLAILRRLSLFHGLGCGVLLGVSRKGLIGAIADEPVAARRAPGSAAIGLWGVAQGMQMLRVHDMQPHRQALALWQSLAVQQP